MRKITIIFCFIIYLMQACNKDKKAEVKNFNKFCVNENLYSKSKNSSYSRGECQVLKLFDEICLQEFKGNQELKIFRIRYFLENDSGFIFTVYGENECGLLKSKKTKSIFFNEIIRENTGDGYSLTFRNQCTYVSNNKILYEVDFSPFIKITEKLQLYENDGRIKDLVELLVNGKYFRYGCSGKQRDSILSVIYKLK